MLGWSGIRWDRAGFGGIRWDALIGVVPTYAAQKRHIWGTHMRAAKSMVRMYNASKEVQKTEKVRGASGWEVGI